jgi:aminotransferase
MGLEFDPEREIVVTVGSTEAMIATLLAVVNPGDEVIVFEPFFENYNPDTILTGATIRYATLYAPDWHFDREQLRALFNDKTKAIVITTPHNPTGKVFTRDELRFIADLCIEHDALAITDEIYEHIWYPDPAREVQHIAMVGASAMRQRILI